MADIKERRKDAGSIKEKRTSMPKELLKQETIHSIQWARQQVQEAAEPEQQENEGAGAGMPRLRVPQIRQHSRSKLKRETHDTPTTAGKSTTGNSIMSTGIAVDSAPSRIQESYTHAQEQGRKLAIRQEMDKTERIKERMENVTPFASVQEQKAETSTLSNSARERFSGRSYTSDSVQESPSSHSHTSDSVRERPASPSASSAVNLQSAPAEHHEAPPKAIKSADKYKHAGIKANPHSIKQSGRRVKTPEAATAKKTAMTNNPPAKSAAKQAAKATKKETTKLAKAVEKAAVSAIKSIGALLGGSAGLVAALLVVIVLAAGLLLSPLGIFFSGDAGGDVTLQQVMSELNTAFSDRITEIENANAHDDLRQDGQRPLWKEILTVYAVKTTTDPENPLDAVSMDEEHAAVLRSIFWDMTVIAFITETYTEEITVLVPTDDSTDEDGMVEETQTVARTRLVISVSGKTAQQMAEEYGFDEKQLGYVTELLSEEYSDFWASLSVPGVGSDDIVAVALSQVGNVGGQPYWSWYGFSSRVEWCACFVSWCSDQCGYIESGIIPKHSYCPTGVEWFRSRGQWQDRNSIPAPGSIIYFDWGGDGVADHVGIVESCDGSTVHHRRKCQQCVQAAQLCCGRSENTGVWDIFKITSAAGGLDLRHSLRLNVTNAIKIFAKQNT